MKRVDPKYKERGGQFSYVVTVDVIGGRRQELVRAPNPSQAATYAAARHDHCCKIVSVH